MTWFVFVAIVLLILGLAAVICWLIFYILFSNSEVKRWRDRLLTLLGNAHAYVQRENQELRRLDRNQDDEARLLRDEAFEAHLREISVEALEEYQGIGPVTIDKLREAGYKNLATLSKARLQIHGLGPKRLADIQHALRALLRKARSTFDAGACRQAATLARKLERRAATHQSLVARAKARAQVAEELIDRLQEPATIARRVTLWRWLRADADARLVPPSVLIGDLPDLEAEVRAADARAVRDGTSQRHEPVDEEELPEAMPADEKPVLHCRTPELVHSAAPNAEDALPEESHLILMELTVQFAFMVARADGLVTSAERELIHEHVRRRFGDNRALLNRAEAFCAHYEKAQIDLQACLDGIHRQFSAAHRAALLSFAGQIVAASGRTPAHAGPFLQRLAQRLGLRPAQAQQTATEAQLARVRELLQNSGQASQAREYDVAVKLLADANALDPTNVEVQTALRKAELARDAVREEVQGEEEALRAAKVRQLVVTGQEQLTANQFEAAGKAFTEARQIPSQDPAVAQARKDLDQARTVAKAAAAIEAGRAAFTAKQYEEAAKAFSEALELMPDDAVATKGLADAKHHECLELLGIAPTLPLSAALVRRQWNLMSQHRLPEKVATMIRQAAETLLKPMGEVLEDRSDPRPADADARHNPDLDEVFGG